MVSRTERLNELLKEEISNFIIREIKDFRVQNKLLSIVDVDISKDLQHAKVYVSVIGSEDEQKEVLVGLQKASGFIKSEIGRRLRLRHTPNIYFKLDNSIKRGMDVIELLDKIKKETIND